jgi:hypothetical protein
LLSIYTLCQSWGMDTSAPNNRYKNHRFPVEIISHAVWLYFRFSLSFRDVEELLSERGIKVTYEAIRKWCRKFGQHYANRHCQLICVDARPEQERGGLTSFLPQAARARVVISRQLWNLFCLSCR